MLLFALGLSQAGQTHVRSGRRRWDGSSKDFGVNSDRHGRRVKGVRSIAYTACALREALVAPSTMACAGLPTTCYKRSISPVRIILSAHAADAANSCRSDSISEGVRSRTISEGEDEPGFGSGESMETMVRDGAGRFFEFVEFGIE